MSCSTEARIRASITMNLGALKFSARRVAHDPLGSGPLQALQRAKAAQSNLATQSVLHASECAICGVHPCGWEVMPGSESALEPVEYCGEDAAVDKEFCPRHSDDDHDEHPYGSCRECYESDFNDLIDI